MNRIGRAITLSRSDRLQPVLLFALMAAAPLPLAADNDDARSLFEDGIDAFHEADYPAALSAFEASYAIRPIPKVLFNIAMCQKAMFRYADALETFKRYVEAAGLTVDSPLYREVLAERSLLLAKVGRIAVVSTPDGASVLLDGKPVGETPISVPRPVDPGTHTVTIESEGYVPYRREVTIASGTTLQLEAALEAEQGTVEIRCPVGAELTLNHGRKEACPYVGTLPARTHRLELALTGVAPIVQTFALRPDERLVLDLTGAASITAPGAGALSTDAALPSQRTAGPSTTLLAAGVVSLTAAAAAAGLGGYFVFRGGETYDSGIAAIEDRDRERYDDINRERLPAYRLGATASFVACGGLLVTGTALLLARQRSKWRALHVGSRGLLVRF